MQLLSIYPLEGSTPKGSIVSLVEYLHYYFKDLGYENIVVYDEIRGFYNRCEEGYIERFAELVHARAAQGRIEAEFAGKNGSATGYMEQELQAPCWICLCDGVGGNAGGKEASVFVCRTLSEQDLPGDAEGVRNLMTRVNGMLLDCAAATPDKKQMATTATCLLFLEDAVYLANIGNTRLYAKRGAFLQQQTVDQTTYQWLLDRGMTDAAEACNKSEIRGAMGGGRKEYMGPLTVERVFERRVPSTLLLTTDGVHEYLSQDELEEILEKEQTALACANDLCEHALAAGSDDDRSAVIIRIMA